MSALHEKVFTEAITRLTRSLHTLAGSDAAFWPEYRGTRQRAFEVEFLSKFYRKAELSSGYEDIITLTKPLEDRLGRLDEIDAMVPFCQKFALHIKNGEEASAHFDHLRKAELKKVRRWLAQKGWIKNGMAYRRLQKNFAQVRFLNDQDNRTYAANHIIKALRKLQDEIQAHEYDPQRRGYVLAEVEPRVHKLRREIRKMAQYFSYTGGLFSLVRPCATHDFDHLLSSAVAKSPYAKLPKARIARPWPVARPLFLALNRYVSDLGQAKDWAFNLERLRQAGLKGEIDFDQLDVTLLDWRGRPTPFNSLVLGVLNEIRQKRPLALMAKQIAQARTNEKEA